MFIPDWTQNSVYAEAQLEKADSITCNRLTCSVSGSGIRFSTY